MRESGSRKACRKASTETSDILIKQVALFFFRSSGPLASEALITATTRLRLCSPSLFSRMGRRFSGASEIGPARAHARRSGDFHAFTRDWPESLLKMPPSAATCAAMQIAPHLLAQASSSPESRLPVGEATFVS